MKLGAHPLQQLRPVRPETGQGPVVSQAASARHTHAKAIDSLSLQPAALDQVKDCRAAWQRSLLARVADTDLSPAVEELFAHHLSTDFYGVRTDGMRRLEIEGPGGKLDVQLAPNRNKVPLAEIKDGENKECALCRPPFQEERGLSWRDYNVWPNAFPYVPTESRHVVITAARHVGQRFTPQLLGDMIDYQRHAGESTPVTMHYNGVAGNSQFHLHWQATRETLPLQRLLDRGELPTELLHSGDGGRVDSYDHGFFTGLLVRGDKGYVSRWATILIDQIDRDPLTRGAYNLLLLHPRDGQARLAIIPRRADDLKPPVGDFGKVGLGAFSLGGTIVVPRDQLPETFAEDLTAAAARTVVRPHELSWLTRVTRQPSNPMLLARTAQLATATTDDP